MMEMIIARKPSLKASNRWVVISFSCFILLE
jgi:hypothetical protein